MSKKQFGGNDAASKAFDSMFNTGTPSPPARESEKKGNGSFSPSPKGSDRYRNGGKENGTYKSNRPKERPYQAPLAEPEDRTYEKNNPAEYPYTAPENSNEAAVSKSSPAKNTPNSKGNVGYKFMMPPELYKALRFRALREDSKSLSDHVQAALREYLAEDLAKLDSSSIL